MDMLEVKRKKKNKYIARSCSRVMANVGVESTISGVWQ